MSPSPPVELAVKVLLPIVKFALPTETVSTGLLAMELGGISPLPPALLVVAVDPESVTVTVTMTIGGGVAILSNAVELSVLDDAEIVTLLPADGADTLEEPTDAGGIKPSPPVEPRVAVDPEVEKSALPALITVVVLKSLAIEPEGTDALGTGGIRPPFPVEV
jgi:hypothetical protein